MRRLLLLILAGVLVAGCAAGRMQPVTVPAMPETAPAGTGWWAARFRIDRPAGESPQWHIGTLLGGEVIAPVFERRFADIMIWRIHRRAGDDDYGHVFSFIFYGSAEGAQRVYQDIAASPVLQQLREQGEVTWVGFDDLAVVGKPDIGATSDSHWDPLVQETWPALAMGASRMWLDLVSLKAQQHAAVTDLGERYRLVQQDINSLWANQGQHAILHHLSAIFAYQPLLIKY